MKNLMKAFLVLALFSSAAFADGDMTGGGRTCPVGQTCITGDMTGGGKTCPQGQTCTGNGFTSEDSDIEDSDDTIFEIIGDYIASIF